MYYAVVAGGPRWDDQAIHNITLPHPPWTADLPREGRARRYDFSEATRLRDMQAMVGMARMQDLEASKSGAILTPLDEVKFSDGAEKVATRRLTLDQIDELAEQSHTDY